MLYRQGQGLDLDGRLNGARRHRRIRGLSRADARLYRSLGLDSLRGHLGLRGPRHFLLELALRLGELGRHALLCREQLGLKPRSFRLERLDLRVILPLDLFSLFLTGLADFVHGL